MNRELVAQSEIEVIAALAAQTSTSPHHLPDTAYDFDGFLLDESGLVVMVVEVKRRYMTIEAAKKYGDIFLTDRKFKALAGLRTKTGIPFVFAVDLADGIYVYQHEVGDEFVVTESGVVSDWSDKPVARIPIAQFRPLSELSFSPSGSYTVERTISAYKEMFVD